jgi:hypothetical protein
MSQRTVILTPNNKPKVDNNILSMLTEISKNNTNNKPTTPPKKQVTKQLDKQTVNIDNDRISNIETMMIELQSEIIKLKNRDVEKDKIIKELQEIIKELQEQLAAKLVNITTDPPLNKTEKKQKVKSATITGLQGRKIVINQVDDNKNNDDITISQNQMFPARHIKVDDKDYKEEKGVYKEEKETEEHTKIDPCEYNSKFDIHTEKQNNLYKDAGNTHVHFLCGKDNMPPYYYFHVDWLEKLGAGNKYTITKKELDNLKNTIRTGISTLWQKYVNSKESYNCFFDRKGLPITGKYPPTEYTKDITKYIDLAMKNMNYIQSIPKINA